MPETALDTVPDTVPEQELLLDGLVYDSLLISLSDVYEGVRHAAQRAAAALDGGGGGTGSGASSGTTPWVPPDQFKRWVGRSGGPDFVRACVWHV